MFQNLKKRISKADLVPAETSFSGDEPQHLKVGVFLFFFFWVGGVQFSLFVVREVSLDPETLFELRESYC